MRSYQGTSTAHLWVTVEKAGEAARIVKWTGRNANTIKRAAKAKYDGYTLRFGRVYYTNSYGAH